MTGNEVITITIEDGDKRVSTKYNIMDANEILEMHSEYHLLMLSDLLKKFNDSKEKDIPWPSSLDYSKINTPKEKLDQNFKDGIRYVQG